MKRSHFIALLLALIVIGGFFIATRQRPFTAVDLGSGYTMRFYSRRAGFMDDMPSSFYVLDHDLVRGSKVIWRQRFGGTFTAPETLQFQALISSDGTVAAIVEAFAPDIVLEIRDLSTGEPTPDQLFREDPNAIRAREHRLLARLQPNVKQRLIRRGETNRQTRL